MSRQAQATDPVWPGRYMINPETKVAPAQQTLDFESMLVYCWSTVYDGCLTLNRHFTALFFNTVDQR